MITAIPARVERREEGANRLPISAMIFLVIVAATAAASGMASLTRFHPGAHNWRDFVILTTAAAASQLFVVNTTRNQSMHAALVFLIPAALFLPPGLIVLMGIATHIPEWL